MVCGGVIWGESDLGGEGEGRGGGVIWGESGLWGGGEGGDLKEV